MDCLLSIPHNATIFSVSYSHIPQGGLPISLQKLSWQWFIAIVALLVLAMVSILWVSQTYHAAYELSQETQQQDSEGKNGFFANLKGNVSALLEKAKGMLSTLVDAVAVLLVTSCVIPIMTALVFLAIIKHVFKLPSVTAVIPHKPRHMKLPE